MKTIMTFAVIGVFAFAGTAAAATVGKQIIQASTWGFVQDEKTVIYRIADKDTTCYLAYAKGNATPVMDCVK